MLLQNEMTKELIEKLSRKPDLFEPGDAVIWTDPHISKQLLAVHLDPATELASRSPEHIRETVKWIGETVGLERGSSILDLGCGPGLFCQLFAHNQMKVTGVDYSRVSIEYAVRAAKKESLPIEYFCKNYLHLDFSNQFDLALLIFGDYCPLSPQDRGRLLEVVHKALKPGGYFILDVSTPLLRKAAGHKNAWYTSKSGFWCEGWHLVLEQGYSYENDVFLDQYVVIDENGQARRFHNWFQDFTPDTIREELSKGRFEVFSIWSDLAGSPYTMESEWIGIVAKKIMS